MKTIFFLLSFLLSFNLFAITDWEKAYLNSENVITNGGAEQGLAGWTEYGAGTLAVETSTILSGKNAFKFTSNSATDYFQSDAKAIPHGPNAQMNFWYKTTSANYTLYVIQGANTTATLALPANTAYTEATATFVSTAGSSYQYKIMGGTSGEIIYLDDATMGKNLNIGSVNLQDKQYDISSYISGFTSITRAIATVSVTRDNTYLMWVDIRGTASAGASVDLTISGVTWKSSFTGQTISGADDSSGKGGSLAISTNTLRIIASTGTPTTFYANGRVELDSIPTWATSTASQQVVRAESSVFEWTGYHSSDCLWTTTSDSYVNTSDDGSCTFTERFNNNAGTVTSAGTKRAGITFTPNSAGTYEICASIKMGTSAATLFGLARLYDGATTIVTESSSRLYPDSTMICGFLNITSTASKTIDVQFKRTGANTTTIGDGGYADSSVEWKIKKVTQQVPMPQIVNSVGTLYNGQVRTERSILNCDAGSAITSQLGTWVSSIGNISTGVCAVTLTSGTFATTPKCSCLDQSSTVDSITKGNASSTTAVSIVGTKPSDGSALTTFDCLLECYEGR